MMALSCGLSRSMRWRWSSASSSAEISLADRRARRAVAGWVRRSVTPIVLHRVYRRGQGSQLRRLDEVAPGGPFLWEKATWLCALAKGRRTVLPSGSLSAWVGLGSGLGSRLASGLGAALVTARGCFDGDRAPLFSLLRARTVYLKQAVLEASIGVLQVGTLGEGDGSIEGAILAFGALYAAIALLAFEPALTLDDERVVGDL